MKRFFVGALALLVSLAGFALTPSAPGEALRARHAALAESLAHNDFRQPMHLESSERSNQLAGDIHAVVDHPFRVVHDALQGAGPWCDILILHLNIKYCRVSPEPDASLLAVGIGKKHDQRPGDAYRVDFAYRLAASTPDYLRVEINADKGPFGTHDYRIVVEATPLDAQHSFLHLSYAYGHGLAARLAMQAYLGTLGSGKVGFSVVGRRGGQPVHVNSMRGVVERNTMRYYLAIDAYLDSLAAPPAQRQERRLREWFAATERYARQLHEIDEAEYLAMKRNEIARQQVATAAKAG